MNTSTAEQRAFYVPGEMYIVSVVDPKSGEPRSMWGGETLEELRAKYGETLTIMPLDEATELASKARHDAHLSLPVPITREAFEDAFEILPPLNWQTGDGSMSFRLCEAVTDDLYTAYIQIGDLYFSCTQPLKVKHQQLVEMCLASRREKQ